VEHGRVLCATCYCGEDADFGNGPRLFIDNDGPAAGLLQQAFKDYFEDPNISKVFHNYSFDRHMLRRHNVRVNGFHADTMHMARVWNTSLSSWEGQVQARSSRDPARTSGLDDLPVGFGVSTTQSTPGHVLQGGDASSAGQVFTRAVRSVRLCGGTLDKKLWASASAMHTVTFREEAKQAKAKAPRSRGMMTGWAEDGTDGVMSSQVSSVGYGLKQLAQRLGVVEEGAAAPRTFEQRFGVHEGAALEAHSSPGLFFEWVDYATQDAMMTHRLFEKLRKILKDEPWYSQVHTRPKSELLSNPEVARELLSPESRNYRNAQHASGRSMWDFYQAYLKQFAVCLADLEEVGVGVDCNILRDLDARMSRDLQKHQKGFAKCASSFHGPGGRLRNPDADFINVQSSPQLRLLLFGGSANRHADAELLETAGEFPRKREDSEPGASRRFSLRSLELKPSHKQKDFSESGWPKVTSSIMRELAGDPDRGQLGHAYSQWVKQGVDPQEAKSMSHGLLQLSDAKRIKAKLAGYIRPLLEHCTTTGRIHPRWNFDTSTGRLACRGPNLQNLPTVSSDDYQLRDAFRPAPGNRLVIADYSQLELRILAHVANCRGMIKKFARGGDYHSEVAVEMFPHIQQAIAKGDVVVNEGTGKPTVKERFSPERSQAKAINFGIVYGQTAHSLAEVLGVSKEEAEALIETWFKRKPEVKKWMKCVVQDGFSDQRVLSLLGRWRNLPFLTKTAEPRDMFRSQRAAANFVIQGSAADIMIAAMLRLWRHARLKDLGFRLVLQVHDEFVWRGQRRGLERPKSYCARSWSDRSRMTARISACGCRWSWMWPKVIPSPRTRCRGLAWRGVSRWVPRPTQQTLNSRRLGPGDR
jgi:DNA polymerase I-like protein with 3'-5' exonuclease and polymerase domains